jgi:heme-degrading monooxygenase HmoA
VIIHIVHFTSALPDERIQELYTARMAKYEAVPGLLQKHYLRYENGQHGAVYMWDSPEALQAFRDGEMFRSIADTYQVSESTHEVADVVLSLRAPGAAAGTPR